MEALLLGKVVIGNGSETARLGDMSHPGVKGPSSLCQNGVILHGWASQTRCVGPSAGSSFNVMDNLWVEQTRPPACRVTRSDDCPAILSQCLHFPPGNGLVERGLSVLESSMKTQRKSRGNFYSWGFCCPIILTAVCHVPPLRKLVLRAVLVKIGR